MVPPADATISPFPPPWPSDPAGCWIQGATETRGMPPSQEAPHHQQMDHRRNMESRRLPCNTVYEGHALPSSGAQPPAGNQSLLKADCLKRVATTASNVEGCLSAGIYIIAQRRTKPQNHAQRRWPNKQTRGSSCIPLPLPWGGQCSLMLTPPMSLMQPQRIQN